MNLNELLGEENAKKLEEALKDYKIEVKLGEHRLGVVDNGTWLPKSKLDAQLEEIKGLKAEVTARDEQLGVLKDASKGNDELLKKIDELQVNNETTRTEYEQKLKDTQLSTALKLALNGKVQDFDIIANLIDKNVIELDENGNVTKGLDEQVATLKESKSFLFVPDAIEKPETEPTPTPKMSLGNPNPGAPVGDAFDAALAKFGL